MLKLLLSAALLVTPLVAHAQDAHGRHDIALNAIRNVKAVVDTTVPTTTHTIGVTTAVIAGSVPSLGDPIPGCVGRVCGGGIGQ